ncbi:hypothetical protein [Asticcacaulis excentricus]|uniref:Uncharacterized protein n=1 Tax=Asticcacaulis excentricus (strain ATCC 15261 / DSM 4724 / KCTC 12464 / NCIMB 9791 / VKM B-1370 / CB 48) TaxID=573065 RepID=E8RNW7_ASTEC|nr:hypothetical protein [Asticcacaulis excentricus]ADU11880.1 hypothetical protein Astex_0179 [Asticcacaulis excentricus CB 48]
MPNIEIAKRKKSQARPKTVGVKTITTDQGEKSRVYTVSNNSLNLGQDLLYAFRKSVEKARDENLKLFGTRSGK